MKYVLILVLLSGCTVNKALKYDYQQTLAKNNVEISLRPDTMGTYGGTFNTEMQY